MEKQCIINPLSKRPITVGGKLYRQLMRNGDIKPTIFTMKKSKDTIKKLERLSAKQKKAIEKEKDIPEKIMKYNKQAKELNLKPQIKKQRKEPSPAQLAAREKFAERAKLRSMEQKGKKQTSQLDKTEKKYTKTIDKLRKKGKSAKNLLDRDLEELD